MVLSPLGHDTALFYTVLASSLELGPVGGGGAGWPPRASSQGVRWKMSP